MQDVPRESGARAVDFNRDIRPILSDTCYACHGPDEKQRMVGLRFDTKEGAFAKPGVIVPGDAAASRLVQRITAKDEAVRMPPAAAGRSLTDSQVALLQRWVEEGARWETHWAYVPPRRIEPPGVRQTGWPRNAIDRFILARLEREGLNPSPEADRVTLLRRVSLDLTGLPPAPAEIESFLADPDPDAYEKRVDALLHSPHYGERMALQWLDLARYADTHGYHIDSHRDMWRWRDWVIQAFNRNLPFDRFTIEQLAGDLLPDASLDQKIASGFNRNHMINYEGGAIPEEYLVEYVVDRVETTSNVWMATTMGCARCHTHKYDPISQKEFYQFYAFFNTVAEEGLDGRTGNARPFLTLPTPEQKSALEDLQHRLKVLDEKLSDEQVRPLQAVWEQDHSGRTASSPTEGLTAYFPLDGSFADISGGYRHGRTLSGDPTFGSGQVGRAVSFDGDTHVTFGRAGAFERDEPFSLAMWIRGGSNTPITILQKLENSESRRGFEIYFDDLELIGIQRRAARLNVRLTSSRPRDAIEVRTATRLPLNNWHHVVITYDGSGKAAGLKLHLEGKPHRPEVRQDNLTGSTKTGAELQIGNKAFGRPYKGQVDDLRMYDRALSEEEIEHLAVRFPVQSILSGIYGKPSKEEAARVREYYLSRAAPENLRTLHAELKSVKQQKEDLEKTIESVMIMKEMEKPRETFVLGRGDYRNKTEKVSPGVPAVLPPLPKDAPLNRHSLARWLLDPGHPLTARVAVNRYWQMYFGAGIVKTVEDFGSQGEPPSHPDLLDWLATEFVRTGWDVRAMQRLIVTSATYRQSSKVTPALQEKDPENRLFARGPRFRLSAETVRDNALAAAGLLNRAIGGPSVYPYQPGGIWEELAFGDGFSAQSYIQGTGPDLHRRSMYTFWKRTAPPASLATFDAPDREKCTGRRALTNTPLQALVLLNDPTYVEAARALAERMIREAGKEADGRIARGFRLATSRIPSPREAGILKKLLSGQLAHYRRDRRAADALLAVGELPRSPEIDNAELAAWTMVASAILNLDETITKE